MILVFGATGTNGREIVDRLASGGHSVRAVARDPAKAGGLAKPGVEVVAGDLGDPGSIVSAPAGVDHVFYLNAVDPRSETWFDNFLAAVAEVGRKPHVVKFSGMGAKPDSPSELMRQHGRTDRKLIESGLPYTILQPNSFHQNLFWSAGTIKDHGAFYLPLGEARQSLVDTRDIAEVAFKALTEPGHEGKTYLISGPEALTYSEVAEQISVAIGKPVRYVAVPPEAALDSMLNSGMPEWNANAVTELYRMFAAGLAATVTDDVETVTGCKPIRFSQFAKEFVGAFV